MKDTVKIAYMLILSHENVILDTIRRSDIDMPEQLLSKTFSFVNSFDINPYLPWFAKDYVRRS